MISVGSIVKLNRLMKTILQYFFNVISNILFVIWQDFVIV